MTMAQRVYGGTGVTVSALGFGGMRFEHPDDPEECAALVRAAYDAGITYFDTAPGYFDGKSESNMGRAFREMAKTRAQRPFYVATKTFADNPDAVRAECERSLKRLQVDAIDFYHMWCILSPEAYKQRTAKDTLRAFERLKTEGLVKHICVSSHMSGGDIAGLLEDYPFEGVLLGYSAMNFGFREAALAAAAKHRRGVVVMNPLGGGNIPDHPERFGYLRTRPAAEETVVEAALWFLWSDPRITVTLVGMKNQHHLREAVKAMEGHRPLSADDVARIRQGLEPGLDAICTGCGYCDDCPQGLPVPKHMDAYNQFLLTGERLNMARRMMWHWGTLRDNHRLDVCTECGACEAACTQKLPIIQRLKELGDARQALIEEQARKAAK